MAQEAGVGYMVFARKEYAEPLRFQGTWEGPNDPEAVFQHFGREWIEVVLIPQSAVRWVIRAKDKEGIHV
uniref:Uncharacterized protein n=1 Tax=Thermus caliditerrae TaxID=1330700 RepID=A0A7C5REC6_9DEIN